MKPVQIQWPVGSDGKRYPSRVETVGENGVGLKWPFVNGVRVRMEECDEVELSWRDNTGLFLFRTRLSECRRFPQPIVFVPTPTEDAIRSLRRRAYFRLPIRITCTCTLLNAEGDGDKEQEAKTVDGITRDLSGGGLALVLPIKCDDGSRFKIDLYLSKEEKIKVLAKKVRDIPHNKRNQYAVGLQIIEIDERDRDALVQYILKQEIRQKSRV